MALIAQSTVYPRSFIMISTADHITGKTGASPVVTISKAGGAFAAAAGAVTELTNGWYSVAFTVADTNTLGDLAVHVTGTGADPTDFTDQVGVIGGGGATPAQIATAVWQDVTASDFTTVGSIGYSLYTGVAPGSQNGMFIAGINYPTTVTFTGNFNGSVKSVIDPVTVKQEQQMPGAARWSKPT